VLPAARAVLSDPALPAWSIETVESAAGVTRMTVYNQFGSRAALIEAGIGVTRGADQLVEEVGG
jgi:AcrR family transcriptional regulator